MKFLYCFFFLVFEVRKCFLADGNYSLILKYQVYNFQENSHVKCKSDSGFLTINNSGIYYNKVEISPFSYHNKTIMWKDSTNNTKICQTENKIAEAKYHYQEVAVEKSFLFGSLFIIGGLTLLSFGSSFRRMACMINCGFIIQLCLNELLDETFEESYVIPVSLSLSFIFGVFIGIIFSKAEKTRIPSGFLLGYCLVKAMFLYNFNLCEKATFFQTKPDIYQLLNFAISFAVAFISIIFYQSNYFLLISSTFSGSFIIQQGLNYFLLNLLYEKIAFYDKNDDKVKNLKDKSSTWSHIVLQLIFFFSGLIIQVILKNIRKKIKNSKENSKVFDFDSSQHLLLKKNNNQKESKEIDNSKESRETIGYESSQSRYSSRRSSRNTSAYYDD